MRNLVAKYYLSPDTTEGDSVTDSKVEGNLSVIGIQYWRRHKHSNVRSHPEFVESCSSEYPQSDYLI